MAVDRLLPTDEGAELVALVREIAQAELAPRAAADEAVECFPRDAFAMLGEVGLLGLPYPEEYGGAGQPYEVYLQALEEVAAAWMTVGVGVSVLVVGVAAHLLLSWDWQVAFLVAAIKFAVDRTDANARLLFFGSITYLPLLWALLCVARA